MSNLTNTTLDHGSVQVGDCEFDDELLTLAGADELKAGTILARASNTLKLVLFVKGGSTNENGIPKFVLPVALSSTTSGSHDEPVRVISKGIVDLDRLVIDADGDASNVDGAVKDQLRSYGIVPVKVDELARVDNPQPEPEGS
jgi:hypothetical protein